MQNILVPTDFSPESHHAFEVAVHLAQRTGGQITLLHVLDTPGSSGIASTGGPAAGSSLDNVYVFKLLQVTKHRMQRLIAEAGEAAQGITVHDVIDTGSVDAAILSAVKERGIDLVVMGAHEHKSWERIFVTSTTERVVRLAPCPVLTVKHPVPDFDVHSIVFASDFTAEADRVVPSLRQIQAVFPDATLHLLDVEPNPDRHAAALAQIDNFARRNQLEHYEPDVFDAPKPSTGISLFAEKAHADLVVMLTHGRTGLNHLLQGSISESVAVHAATPVLTLHA